MAASAGTKTAKLSAYRPFNLESSSLALLPVRPDPYPLRYMKSVCISANVSPALRASSTTHGGISYSAWILGNLTRRPHDLILHWNEAKSQCSYHRRPTRCILAQGCRSTRGAAFCRLAYLPSSVGEIPVHSTGRSCSLDSAH